MKTYYPSNYSIDQLVNKRIIIEKESVKEIVDLLCFNSSKAEVLIDYCDGTGETRTYWMSKAKLMIWLQPLLRYHHYIL